MRTFIALLLVISVTSCGNKKSGSSPGAEEKKANDTAGTSSEGDKAPAGKPAAPEAAMKDTVVTVDVTDPDAKVTLTIPAGWTRDAEEDLPSWQAPEIPDPALHRPSMTLSFDSKPADKSYADVFKKRMEWDKKFEGNKFSGDKLLDPENKIGRKLTVLASEEIPNGWLWAYEITYDPKTAGLLRPYFKITVWRYQPGDTDIFVYYADGQMQYKEKYYEKLLQIGKDLKIVRSGN